MSDRERESSVDLAPPKEHRLLGIALALIAAGLLGTAAFSPRWLANPNASLFEAASLYTDASFSLRAYTACTGGDCIHVSNSAYAEIAADAQDPHNISAAFAPFGWITFVTCLIGAVALLISALLAIARRRPDWPMAPTTIAFLALAASLITGCVFCATKPGLPGFVGVSWGFYTFGAGAVAGLVGSQFLARALRPIDPDLMADAMDPDDF